MPGAMRLFSRSSEGSGGGDTTENDVDLFARLLAAHEDKLYRVAFRMTGDADDAQDLVQDALVEAFRSFKRFQRGTYFDKWLYRIMTNTFIDWQRHRKRVGYIESLDAPAGGDETGSGREIADWKADPARQTEQDLFNAPLQAALDSLPPEFRMVLILADVEEFSYEEVAEMMGSPIGTVRSRLHRARTMMRLALGDKNSLYE